MNLGKLILNSTEKSADLQYAAQFSAPDDFIWFSAGNIQAVVMSALEFGRAKAVVPAGVAVFPEQEFGKNRLEIICNIAKRCQLDGFEVPEDFPLKWADLLRKENLTVTAKDGAFFPEREFKSLEEVSKITASLRAAEAGCRHAVEILRAADIGSGNKLIFEGRELTSEILRHAIDSKMMEYGMLPTGTICAGGVQGSQPHNAGSGVLYAHTPIVMDIFPRSAETGYWGDLTRTVVKGRAESIVKRAYEAVFEAREHAKSIIRSGLTGAFVHNEAAKVLEKHRFYTGKTDRADFGFFHGLGHGVGLDIHENPRLSPRADTVLAPRSVITIEPGLYYPEWGGIRLEDMVYLKEDGSCMVLTAMEDFLEV